MPPSLLRTLISQGSAIVREAGNAMDRSGQTETVHIREVEDWHRRSAAFLAGSNPSVAAQIPILQTHQSFEDIYVAIRQTLTLLEAEQRPSPPAARSSAPGTGVPAEATSDTGTSPASTGIDVAVICALPQIELETVRRLGKLKIDGKVCHDPQTYYTGTQTSLAGTSIRLIASAPNQMGLSAAGVLAAKVVFRFRPRLVVMVGIAAGARKGKQGFGDILIPDQTYDFGSAKTNPKSGAIQVAPNPNPLPVRPELLSRLHEWKTDRRALDAIAKTWRADKPTTNLDIHIGPVFSSPTVLNAKIAVKDQMTHWRKLIGVEMEAHAVHRACHETVQPPPAFLCMKSVCDFAQNKNDAWQRYAAFTSTSLFFRFLRAEWERIVA